ncbi:MAG TPA: hypothetical protein VMH22_03430 [bacterium]|nr:hypothetical protein [bacterium]
MNLVQKIAAAVTLLLAAAFLLTGGHKVHHSGSHYVLDDYGQHYENYDFTRTDRNWTAIDLAVILVAGGAGIWLLRSKRTRGANKPGRDG